MEEILGLIGITFLAFCFLLLGAFFVGLSVKDNKFIRLFPLWVGAYGIVLPSISPLLWFRWWEGPEDFIFGIYTFVLFALVLLILATLVIAIVKKRYFTAIGVVVMGVFIFLYSAWTMVIVGLGEGHGDNFGKRHPIPEGMEYYTFLDDTSWGYGEEEYTQAQLDSLTIKRGILLQQHGQDGQYRYMANVPAIPERGKIYLKLYEATTNLPLSEYIKYNTTIEVEASDTAIIYAMKSEGKHSVETKNTQYFTVQEGSWDDYYAARVELWYQPESGGEEQLLHSVIYQIEGWSR